MKRNDVIDPFPPLPNFCHAARFRHSQGPRTGRERVKTRSGPPLALRFREMLNGIASKLEHYMDLLAARQKVVASNIANADTPGYHTRDIDFQRDFLALAPGEKPTVDEVEGLQSKTDGNNVDMDREARLLAENALRFNLASNLLRAQVQMVRNAIQEGRNG